MSSKPRLTGSTPNDGDIAEFSAIRLNFNKVITNKDEVIKEIKIEPLVNIDVLVDEKQIIIVPLEYFNKSAKYNILIPNLKFGEKEINNFVFNFTVLDEPNNNSSDANIDESDFIQKKYPGLVKLASENNEHYKISYELGDTLIISINLLDIKKIDEELPDYLKKLDKYNAEVKEKITKAGINLDEVVLSYPNELQRSRYISSQEDQLDGDGGVYPYSD
ncbi:MAG: hypothetical protein H6799_03620 [Candidatus Nomurabacteria bacterium]|nr:MAG: hypothetical protein H6799_03620 [Candidatus Nomurabacteria bacterium]HRV76349.1 hypothetical protein [Candidatus Saccharimonadales bacterium]